jgi:GTP cyclohydrolase FolE2
LIDTHENAHPLIVTMPALADIPIEQVGVTGLRYPITMLDRATHSQRPLATLSLSSGLPHDAKGIYMSRTRAAGLARQATRSGRRATPPKTLQPAPATA